MPAKATCVFFHAECFIERKRQTSRQQSWSTIMVLVTKTDRFQIDCAFVALLNESLARYGIIVVKSIEMWAGSDTSWLKNVTRVKR